MPLVGTCISLLERQVHLPILELQFLLLVHVNAPALSFLFCCSVKFLFLFLGYFFPYVGASADYSMDLHHKEQLHDNVSMMQAQHYSVS
jgi:hypothetical protein